MKSQVPLSFPVHQSYAADDFMPLPCNEQALDWIEKFPDWSYPVLLLYGEKGCGKTHLLKLWADKAGDKGIAIDDVELMFGDDEAERELFHKINQAREDGGFLMLTLSKNIGQQTIALPDLASRLRAAPSVEILHPTETDLQAVLVKLFHDRQLRVEPGVLAYILPRIERSFTAINDLVDKIDKAALAEKRAVTVPLVRDVLVEPELF